jgi:hypothetical protein
MRATARSIASGLGVIAMMALADAGAALAQHRDARPRDRSFQALDALVHDGSLVTLERTRCDVARAFEAGECGALVSRSLEDGSIRFRTAIPIPLRGLLQLERFELADHTMGYLLRAHDRGCVVAATGRVIEEARMPISTYGAPVWLEAASGAVVFHERGGCSAYVAGRGDLAHGRYVRGVESHVYAELGQPHDTVCFGFQALPIGEVALGRGLTRVLVAVTELDHPADAGPPSIVAFDRDSVAYTVEVGAEGERLESVSLEGTHAVVIVAGERSRRRVTVDATSGQRLSITAIDARPTASDGPDAGPVPDADTAPIAHDRRGIPIQRFARCTVTEAGGRHRVRFDGREIVSSERRVLVLDQRGGRCVALELGAGSVEDVVHIVSP